MSVELDVQFTTFYAKKKKGLWPGFAESFKDQLGSKDLSPVALP